MAEAASPRMLFSATAGKPRPAEQTDGRTRQGQKKSFTMQTEAQTAVATQTPEEGREPIKRSRTICHFQPSQRGAARSALAPRSMAEHAGSETLPYRAPHPTGFKARPPLQAAQVPCLCGSFSSGIRTPSSASRLAPPRFIWRGSFQRAEKGTIKGEKTIPKYSTKPDCGCTSGEQGLAWVRCQTHGSNAAVTLLQTQAYTLFSSTF